MTTREQIATALLDQLKTIAAFKTAPSRRLLEPSQIKPENSPALYLVDAGGAYQNMAPQNPPKRTLHFSAVIYNRVAGGDIATVPATIVNNALDALDALMKNLGHPVTGRVTLDGRVYHVRIEGDVVMAAGETSGLAMAVVPFEVVLP